MDKVQRMPSGVKVSFLLVGVVLAALGAGLALWLQPAPHSDWLYYWTAAGSPSRYERGGLGLWLLAIPKAAGLDPVASSLLLNIASAWYVLWMGWRSDLTRWRALALLVAGYLLLIAPFFGLVQLDLFAATMLAAAFGRVLQPAAMRGAMRIAAAVLMVAAAVSTKPQYALTLWVLLGLLALPCLAWKPPTVAKALLAVLLAGSLLGFGLDSGLRSLSGRTDAIRTNSAVTLYGGLLVSRIEGCGYWSVEAAEAAKADLSKPLVVAVRDRLAAKPVSHWISIIRCKWPQIVRPPPFALYWLVESPNVRARIEADAMRDEINTRYRQAIRAERILYGWLTAMILLASAVTCALAWRRGGRLLALLPVFWVLSFWIVHLVFEIQGRYFLGMFLIVPILCALVLRGVSLELPKRRVEAVEPAAARLE
jgi:hypothetical protein